MIEYPRKRREAYDRRSICGLFFRTRHTDFLMICENKRARIKMFNDHARGCSQKVKLKPYISWRCLNIDRAEKVTRKSTIWRYIWASPLDHCSSVIPIKQCGAVSRSYRAEAFFTLRMYLFDAYGVKSTFGYQLQGQIVSQLVTRAIPVSSKWTRCLFPG